MSGSIWQPPAMDGMNLAAQVVQLMHLSNFTPQAHKRLLADEELHLQILWRVTIPSQHLGSFLANPSRILCVGGLPSSGGPHTACLPWILRVPILPLLPSSQAPLLVRTQATSMLSQAPQLPLPPPLTLWVMVVPSTYLPWALLSFMPSEIWSSYS